MATENRSEQEKKRSVGRPLKFETVDQLALAIQNYFAECDPHTTQALVETGRDSKGSPWAPADTTGSARSGREYEESRALHIISDLVRDYPGIDGVSLRGSISEVLRQVAIRARQRRPVPVGLRRAVLRMADLLRHETQPSND